MSQYIKTELKNRLAQQNYCNMFGWYLDLLELMPSQYGKWHQDCIDWYKGWDKIKW